MTQRTNQFASSATLRTITKLHFVLFQARKLANQLTYFRCCCDHSADRVGSLLLDSA